jgi:hypothetical protein
MEMSATADRKAALEQFYRLLDVLYQRVGGYRVLKDCHGGMAWPRRGVYFFFEEGEYRQAGGLRVVRVGTHAVSAGSQTTLWDRLRAHRGPADPSRPSAYEVGGSAFRLQIAIALDQIQDRPNINQVIGRMPFLWVGVDDEPSPLSERRYVERSAVALLSNYGKAPIDSPSPTWLGRHSVHGEVKLSGQWSLNDVDRSYKPHFLDVLSYHVARMPGSVSG